MTKFLKPLITMNFSTGIFFNLAETFDTVNHLVLLSKLEHFGIRGTSVEWFKTYLSDRQQQASCNSLIIIRHEIYPMCCCSKICLRSFAICFIYKRSSKLEPNYYTSFYSLMIQLFSLRRRPCG